MTGSRMVPVTAENKRIGLEKIITLQSMKEFKKLGEIKMLMFLTFHIRRAYWLSRQGRHFSFFRVGAQLFKVLPHP